MQRRARQPRPTAKAEARLRAHFLSRFEQLRILGNEFGSALDWAHRNLGPFCLTLQGQEKLGRISCKTLAKARWSQPA